MMNSVYESHQQKRLIGINGIIGGALSVAWAQRPHQVASTFQNSISQV
jgi:hypothetical protein